MIWCVKVVPCFDVTPRFDEEDDVRGYKIQAWLELNPEVDRYAILDDGTSRFVNRATLSDLLCFCFSL